MGLMRASPMGLRMMSSEAKEEYDAVVIGGGEFFQDLYFRWFE